MSKKDNLFWLDSGWQPVGIAFCPSKEAWIRARKRYRLDAEYPEIAGYGGRCQLFISDETHHAIIVVWISYSSERDAMEVVSTISNKSCRVMSSRNLPLKENVSLFILSSIVIISPFSV